MASIEYLKKSRFNHCTLRLYGCNDFGCPRWHIPQDAWTLLKCFCPDQPHPKQVDEVLDLLAEAEQMERCFPDVPSWGRTSASLEVAETFIPFWKRKSQHEWFPCETSFFLWPFKWSPFFVAKVKSPVGDFVATTSLRLSPTILWSKPLPSEPTTPLPVRRSAECAVGPGYASTPASGQVIGSDEAEEGIS